MSDRQQILNTLTPHKSAFDEESDRSWEYYMRNAQHRKRDPNTQKYFPLDALHIFILSNIVGRPIIVYTSQLPSNEPDFANSIRYEGVYLPFTRPIDTCIKSPIVIGYDSNRFVPLLSTENADLDIYSLKPFPNAQHCIPLGRKNLSNIPVRFLLPPELQSPIHVLQRYLDLITIPHINPGSSMTAARLSFKAPNEHSLELMWSLLDTVKKYAANDENTKSLLQQQDTTNQPQHQSINPALQAIQSIAQASSSTMNKAQEQQPSINTALQAYRRSQSLQYEAHRAGSQAPHGPSSLEQKPTTHQPQFENLSPLQIQYQQYQPTQTIPQQQPTPFQKFQQQQNPSSSFTITRPFQQLPPHQNIQSTLVTDGGAPPTIPQPQQVIQPQQGIQPQPIIQPQQPIPNLQPFSLTQQSFQQVPSQAINQQTFQPMGVAPVQNQQIAQQSNNQKPACSRVAGCTQRGGPATHGAI